MQPQIITIRLAQLADIDAIFTIRINVTENHLSREELAALGITKEAIAESLANSHFKCWVAEINRQIIGFSMADSQTSAIFAIFIAKEFQRQGAGKRLLAHAEQFLKEQGCHRIWLETDPNKAINAFKFYNSMGWHDQGIENGERKFIKVFAKK